MRRFIVLPAIIMMITLAFTGCEWLFGPTVDQVNPSDLENFTASQTFSDTSEDGILETTGGAGGSLGLVFSEMFMRVDEEMAPDTSITSFEDAFQALVNQTTRNVQARALAAAGAPSASVTVTDDAPNDDDTVDVTIEIVDEPVNATDVGLQSGTATVDFFLDLYGTSSSTTNDDGTVTSIGEGQGEHEGTVVYDEWSDGVYVVHQGQINTTASGSLEAEVTNDLDAYESYGTVEWQIAMAMSAGFSVSNTVTDEGGKIVIEYTYNASDSVTVAEGEDPSTAAGEIDATMTVVLYDNNNQEIQRHEYTSEDVTSIAMP
jgi:hypothetical protein